MASEKKGNKKSPDTNQRFWEDELRRAKRRKEQWEDYFRVSDCYNFFLGDQMPENYSENEWFTINLVFANVRAQLPSLYFQNPYIYMRLKRSFNPKPESWDYYRAVIDIREKMLNYLKDEKNKDSDLKGKIRLSILDAYFRFGVLKARYVPSYEDNPNAGKRVKSDKVKGEYLKDPDTGDYMVEEDQLLVGEQFVWERINPKDFLVNADAGCESFAWAGDVTRIDEELCNKMYPDADGHINGTLVRSDYKDNESQYGDAHKSEGFLSRFSSRTDPLFGRKAEKRDIKDVDAKDRMVMLWEIYDLVRNKKWCIAEGHHTPVGEKDIPPGIEYHPFAFLRFNDNTDKNGRECWYPIPEIFNSLGPAHEYNLARNDVAIHRKRFKRKYGYLKGSIDDEELSKFEDPCDGSMVGFDDPTWMQTFGPIQDAGLNEAVKIDSVQMRGDFDDVFGSTPEQVGRSESDTATEAHLREKHLQIRESDKQGRVREFVIDAARKMTQLLEENLSTEGAIFVVGPKGKIWQPYKPSDFQRIPAEVEFDIDVTQMAPRDDKVQRAQWMQFLGSAMQVPMIFQDPEVLTWWAKKFDIHDEGMLMRLAQGFARMTQMAQQQQGVLQNTPGQSGGPTSLGNVFSAIEGGKTR